MQHDRGGTADATILRQRWQRPAGRSRTIPTRILCRATIRTGRHKLVSYTVEIRVDSDSDSNSDSNSDVTQAR